VAKVAFVMIEEIREKVGRKESHEGCFYHDQGGKGQASGS
jgi:hypothetical protein